MMRDPHQNQNGVIVRFYRRLCYVLCGLISWSILSACSPAPEGLAHLIDYQSRVASTLNRKPVEYQPSAVSQLPDIRELRTDYQRVSISLLDSWRINECAAGHLIAERNSALGKLEQGLSRYHTDLRLVVALQQCITLLSDDDPALAQRLSTALKQKRANLAALKQQAIATDPALRHGLRIGAAPLRELNAQSLAQSLSALATIVQLVESPTDTSLSTSQLPSTAAVEQALQTLHQSDYLPQLWRTLHTQQHYLEQLAPLLVDLATAAGCDSPGTPERATILHRVFLKFFIGQVQPQLAATAAQGAAANQLLQQLNTAISNPKLERYITQLQGLSPKLTHTTKAHVKPWQDFFSQCGFEPGAQ
ncbi:hypothetical protein PSI9734_00686 [Pseudidiomarina piscicola]|uniref:DUF3080 domain-containing protein n=1 Tax=Pseudidiomarina piscicola TaxID=2614830 RepID=A0A6S6WKS4_9GAMM|nr:DUF3080 family protein [Pseudidiomarina piscicola]CAB0150120.1 hypothetical protein PSI9734_00686 [Pseudidiomarina piscicola]VZT39560.1 hypothetical protein PSI9734_00686 [Pseudomonas aeruginosa]